MTSEELHAQIDDLAATGDSAKLHALGVEAAKNNNWDLANAYILRANAVDARLAGNIQRATRLELDSEDYIDYIGATQNDTINQNDNG